MVDLWAEPKLTPGIDTLSFCVQVHVCVWLHIKTQEMRAKLASQTPVRKKERKKQADRDQLFKTSRETDDEGISTFASSAIFNKLWPATVHPGFMFYASRSLVPCSKWSITASKLKMLCFTHLLLRPPPDSGSTGTDKLCLGRSGRMGAGRLHAATVPSGLGNKLKSMCLSGRGNSTFPWTLVWRRSQYGTEQGFARDDSSEGVRLNTAVSGISQG